MYHRQYKQLRSSKQCIYSRKLYKFQLLNLRNILLGKLIHMLLRLVIKHDFRHTNKLKFHHKSIQFHINHTKLFQNHNLHNELCKHHNHLRYPKCNIQHMQYMSLMLLCIQYIVRCKVHIPNYQHLQINPKDSHLHRHKNLQSNSSYQRMLYIKSNQVHNIKYIQQNNLHIYEQYHLHRKLLNMGFSKLLCS